MTLELTDVERLILSNQYDILAKFDPDGDYALWAETLRAGHKYLYDNYFQHIEPNLPGDKADFVVCILGIYADLSDSYNKLSDKDGITKEQVAFPGFDGNNEMDLLSFAESLRKNQKFTQTLGASATNSHYETVEIYERMIECWKSLDKPSYPYSKKVILKILNSRQHPDNKTE